MEDSRNVRTVAIVGGIDNGKTTLVDSMLSPFLYETADFSASTMTVKATPVSTRFEVEPDNGILKRFGKEFLINFIDCPGHLDLTEEVNAALHIADGTILVVDCSLGPDIHTETMLRRALAAKVRPALVINKFDLPLLEKDVDKEVIYQSLKRTVDDLTSMISSCPEPSLGDPQLFPEHGNVAFTSGLHGWGFTLRQFAGRYAKKFGIEEERILAKLWGENYFNPAIRKWTDKGMDADGQPLERAFNMLVLDPILNIVNEPVTTSDQKAVNMILKELGLHLSDQERGLEGKALLNAIMRNFLPAKESLLQMIVLHLPSPAVAQRYRVETLYEGPMDDESAVGIRECDPKAPLVLYLSKNLPSSEKGRFYALGRVFSGSVSAGCKVRVKGPHYRSNGYRKADLFLTTIEDALVVEGRSFRRVDSCVAGNIVVLPGVDKFSLKGGTITTSDDTANIRAIKPTMAPLEVTVEVKKPVDHPTLVEGLQRCPNRIWDLVETYTNGLSLKISAPIVSYRETIMAESSITALVKSPDKHNRLFVKASPLGEDLTRAIENGAITSRDDFKARAQLLHEEYQWDLTEARKIWCFGPDATGPNLLVDVTRGVQYLNEIKHSSIAAFQWATKEGVLCEEKMHGVRLNILDVFMNSGAIHRGGGQIISTMRRAVYGASLFAQPTIQEPMYFVEIQFPETDLTMVTSCLQRRRARVLSEEQRQSLMTETLKYTITASLPIIESFGFHAEIHATSKGRASVGMMLDKWECIPGSPYEPGSKLETLIMEIRRRKGLQLQIPPPGSFVDRL
ncbi:hypothetical protein M413DRAFT_446956 [Hebeloma cylindrosporum]|uniref:Tr-type G domain-containing protein n=1 Tax=Hebeloma cylindrosporum TaxID=76867 RepID=A0A0C3C781_HEBCY|nr:hypothetical protein M413DRAFT_446956 [Hebeloma cylindrosporum h7]